MRERRRPMKRRAAVVTVSDTVSRGGREDGSGPEIVRWLERNGFTVAAHEVVPDEEARITGVLRKLLDPGDLSLVITTGGTGFTPRDVTPEATIPVINRRAPGVEELIRRAGLEKGIVTASLGRGVSGIVGRCWIVNLPGSPGAVRDGLDVLSPIIEHALDQLEGEKPHD